LNVALTPPIWHAYCVCVDEWLLGAGKPWVTMIRLKGGHTLSIPVVLTAITFICITVGAIRRIPVIVIRV
jgi:hypothetical protein